MGVEMANRQRNVRVAGLADRLAVVQRFHRGQQPAVLLQVPRKAIQVAAARVRAQRAPLRLCTPRRRHGAVRRLRRRVLGGLEALAAAAAAGRPRRLRLRRAAAAGLLLLLRAGILRLLRDRGDPGPVGLRLRRRRRRWIFRSVG